VPSATETQAQRGDDAADSRSRVLSATTAVVHRRSFAWTQTRRELLSNAQTRRVFSH
jgi:hypothetical protein